MVGSGLVALDAGSRLGSASPRLGLGDGYDVILAALIPALLNTR